MILNATKAKALCVALGAEANDWTGARIALKEAGRPTAKLRLLSP